MKFSMLTAGIVGLSLAGFAMTGGAYAADLEEAPEVQEFDINQPWEGVYVGASIGHVYIEDDDEAFPIAPGVTIPLHSTGEESTVGAFIGVNFQNGQFVYGAEYEYVDIDMQFIGDGIGPIPVFVEDAHILRAKAGYALTDKVLAYVHAGVMHTRLNVGLDDWTPLVGVGVDFKLDDNVVVGAQYTHSWFEDYGGNPIDGHLDIYSARFSYLF